MFMGGSMRAPSTWHTHHCAAYLARGRFESSMSETALSRIW